MYCTVPKGPLRASTSFLAGKFLLFFSWIAWGNLQQQQQKKKCLVLFISSLFWRGRGRGRFGTAAAAAKSTAGPYLVLFLSFPVGRV